MQSAEPTTSMQQAQSQQEQIIALAQELFPQRDMDSVRFSDELREWKKYFHDYNLQLGRCGSYNGDLASWNFRENELSIDLCWDQLTREERNILYFILLKAHFLGYIDPKIRKPEQCWGEYKSNIRLLSVVIKIPIIKQFFEAYLDIDWLEDLYKEEIIHHVEAKLPKAWTGIFTRTWDIADILHWFMISTSTLDKSIKTIRELRGFYFHLLPLDVINLIKQFITENNNQLTTVNEKKLDLIEKMSRKESLFESLTDTEIKIINNCLIKPSENLKNIAYEKDEYERKIVLRDYLMARLGEQSSLMQLVAPQDSAGGTVLQLPIRSDIIIPNEQNITHKWGDWYMIDIEATLADLSLLKEILHLRYNCRSNGYDYMTLVERLIRSHLYAVPTGRGSLNYVFLCRAARLFDIPQLVTAVRRCAGSVADWTPETYERQLTEIIMPLAKSLSSEDYKYLLRIHTEQDINQINTLDRDFFHRCLRFKMIRKLIIAV